MQSHVLNVIGNHNSKEQRMVVCIFYPMLINEKALLKKIIRAEQM
jgi:hypothetical protein